LEAGDLLAESGHAENDREHNHDKDPGYDEGFVLVHNGKPLRADLVGRVVPAGVAGLRFLPNASSDAGRTLRFMSEGLAPGPGGQADDNLDLVKGGEAVARQRKKLECNREVWEFSPVKTLKADPKKRIRIPDIKPGQVLAYENEGNGRFTLTVVKAEVKEPFPKGSLLKYLTPERDKEQLAILKGCVQGPLE
jgi:hypothetical protein